MAQFELANLSANSPAAGTVVEASTNATGRTDGPSLSFGRLLQARASPEPATEATAADPAAKQAANGAAPAAANRQASQPGVADPAAFGKDAAGQRAEVAALVVDVAALANGDEPDEAKETVDEIDAGDPDIADGEITAEAVWPGLPLFMEARAALRDAPAADAKASPSGAAATTGSIGSSRLHFALCSTNAPGQLADDNRLALPAADSAVDATPISAMSVPPNLLAANSDDSSVPVTASGPLADSVRDATRPAGDLRADILADGNRPFTALPAAGAMDGAMPPKMGSTVGMASETAVSVPFENRAANLADSPMRVGARLGSFWSRFEPAATGTATLVAPSIAAAGIEATAEPSIAASALNAPAATAAAGSENIATGWASIIGDPQAARLASGRSFRWRSPVADSLADPLARTGAGLWAGESVSAEKAVLADEVPEAAASAAIESVGDADHPLTPTDQDASSLAISAQTRQRPVDSVAISPTSLPEKSVQDAATIRVGDPAPPGNGNIPVQSGSQPATPVRPDAGTAPPASLPTAPEVLNFNQKNWERALGHQLNWMVNNRLQEAEIKVDPPNLGPLEVRVSLHHNQTNVTFFSHEAAVRDAIENALPRLREMLDGQGISLNQAQVSDQSLARQQAGAGEQSPYGQRDGRLPTTAGQGSETAEDATEARPRSRSLLGMVDDYA